MQTVRAWARNVEDARARAASARVRAARAALPALTKCLADEFGATSITLFGSLAAGEAHERSDIDLAVEGLASEDYFRALASLLEVAPCPVDLVCLEDAPESLRALVRDEGEVLL